MLSKKNQVKRLAWTLVWILLARPLPRYIGLRWKVFLLNLFGAKLHPTSIIHSSVKIYMPWNLEMDEYACLASNVNCYNAALIKIGKYATVSQKTYLCTASHDITDSSHSLITAPIIIEDEAWVATDAFIGMGVIIGQGAVVGARACVFKDVEPWTVVGGNPAIFLKKRVILR